MLVVANRTLVRAVAAGSIPPELDNLWQRLRSSDVKVKLFRRGEGSTRGEQQVPDIMLQNAMLRGHG